MNYINFAIDLGTTNSLIGKWENESVKLFKNPKGFKETIPSCVAFRKGKIFIGEKAREFKDRDPQNVFSSFKRKMGTDESFFINDTSEFTSAIDLSTLVLNELKSFSTEQIVSVVITIPASFDTIQSNATKTAGLNAGFEEVVLLQEPIAACLSVFNQYDTMKQKGKWLIYDLGGGTFDVAIVDASEEELKVIDHQGNNFLGGLDFDIQVLQKIILPQLKTQGKFDSIIEKLISNPEEKAVQSIFNYLLFYAEEIKIELSSSKDCFVEFILEDEEGEEIDIQIEATQQQFNELIEPTVNYTINLISELLESNHLKTNDITEIVLVGGSTYIPYIKQKLEADLQIKINQLVDPTNAIAAGATFYAGNKISKIIPNQNNEIVEKKEINYKIQAVYENQTRETESLILIKSKEEYLNIFYRLFRTDNGYDSGKKLLTQNERLFVPLVKNSTNQFLVELYDEKGNSIDSNAAEIIISQGMFNIDGQPLPHDICIEIDDLERMETVLDVIFEKNSILPLKKTIYKVLSRDLLETGNDSLLINILEGDKNASPTTNQIIGCIDINPKEIQKNIIKDSEIEINIEISESRDISVTAYISFIDFEVKNIFNPSQKSIHLPKLREEIRFLDHCIRRDLKTAVQEENFEIADELQKIKDDLTPIIEIVGNDNDSISSDSKYHAEELKRQCSVRYDKINKNERILNEQKEYISEKEEAEYLMTLDDFPDNFRNKYHEIIAKEKEAFTTQSRALFRSMKKSLEQLNWQYIQNSLNYLVGIFTNYKFHDLEDFKNQKEAQENLDLGDKILERGNVQVTEIRNILFRLYANLKDEHKRKEGHSGYNNMKGTGIR